MHTTFIAKMINLHLYHTVLHIVELVNQPQLPMLFNLKMSVTGSLYTVEKIT